MGMALYAVENYQDDGDNEADLSYNWNGWSQLKALLERWGVPTNHLASANDGDIIPPEDCAAISAAIGKHFSELNPHDQAWLKNHGAIWGRFSREGGAHQC
jgi:hypothetical protein